jgi:HK97 family phage major capsid protein
LPEKGNTFWKGLPSNTKNEMEKKMRKHEPAVVKTTEKQQLAFKRATLKNAADLSVDPRGQDDVKEMHAIRSELRKIARGLLDVSVKEKRNLTDSEEDAFTVATALLDDIQAAFDARDELQHATDSINRVNGAPGLNSTRCLETWSDAKTGHAIPVLGKEHRFADHVRGDQRISAADYFSGITGGPVAPEVRDAMATNVDTAGGFMVPMHISAEVIDLLRAKSVCIKAGARSFPMAAQNVRVCRIDEDPVASWVPENSLIPETSMAIGAVEFFAHKLTTLIKVSRELLQDASAAQSVIMSAISTAMAGELDSACLVGDGVGKPLGITLNPNINTYSLGANGATLSGFSDLLQGISAIANQNGPLPNVAVMSPRTMVGYSLILDGEGNPLLKPDLVKNLVFLDSTKMPVNEVKGSASNCSSIVLGGFNSLVIGIRSELQIQVLNERFADYGQVGFLCTMRADSALYQPKAFCKITGILPNS